LLCLLPVAAASALWLGRAAEFFQRGPVMADIERRLRSCSTTRKSRQGQTDAKDEKESDANRTEGGAARDTNEWRALRR